MGSNEFIDPHIDPTTGLLRNLVAAAWEEPAKAEADFVLPRMLRPNRLTKVEPDSNGLRAIHKFLFEKLFNWAGQVRTVDIRKNREASDFFLPASFIQRAAGHAAEELEADSQLRGLDRRKFIERLASCSTQPSSSSILTDEPGAQPTGTSPASASPA
ncbi:MAG: hypothetical protein LBK54_11160 [Propionibacteriaceae bacterium]|jgi:cell filamentation protein|nr:hypothetical protein [Propionibacteriaceae bacterium]